MKTNNSLTNLFAADYCRLHKKATRGEVKAAYAALKGDPTRAAEHQLYVDRRQANKDSKKAAKVRTDTTN
ncbi:hypothetical protein K439DRAFT_1636488 [Ramaria rubella]|nr:hypothetical protein K439DRAFT_1636488 [Ramaria rubella]